MGIPAKMGVHPEADKTLATAAPGPHLCTMPTVRDPRKDKVRNGEAGLAALETFFRDRETRPGVVARRLVGRPRKEDALLTEQLIQERRRRTRLDGSVDGALVKTAWTAWELLDLGCPLDHSGVLRPVGFVLARQDKPGHFGEGCDPARHEQDLCRHALRGFFSAGTANDVVAPLGFPVGTVIAEENAARFAASCFALRTVLRAGEDQRATVRGHVESLIAMVERSVEWAGDTAPDLEFFALGGMALAPINYRPQVEQALSRVLAQQQSDGTWPGADLFHALDMLLSLPFPSAREALKRATPALLSRQQPSGAFDEIGDEERALVALRVLKLTVNG